MTKLKSISSLKKLTSFLGVVTASALIGLPALAQVNPNPSIFNEPPYNRARGAQASPPTSTTPTAPVAPATSEAPTEASSGTTITAVAASNDSFKILTTALQAADLTSTLSGEGPFTVFAPTDAAFAKLPAGTLEALLKPENKETLVKILTYHVVPGEVTSSQLKSGEVTTVEGSPVTVNVDGGGVMVNKATVVQPDIQASNGVIHVVDTVILPPTL
ncbi:fasciclin domain-containing protein [Trichocoleus sp. FACHB-262]|nr:fasciclin domain-containing protein [Trichocoleus sp. FACHB-262]